MFSLGKEEFITAFDKWCDKWKGFLDEWTLLISGKTTYTHRRLRTVRRSIKTHLTWLYTCEEHPEIQIPNTTNLLEGLNSQLETSAKPHINSEIINITHWLSIVVLSVKRLLQRSQLKRALHNYNGLNEANKKKFIREFGIRKLSKKVGSLAIIL